MASRYAHAAILTRKLPQILTILDVSVPLLAELSAEKVFTSDQIERIEAQPTPIRQQYELVKILKTRSTQHYNIFCEALKKTGQEHVVVDVLQKDEQECDIVPRTFTNALSKEEEFTGRTLRLYEKIVVISEKDPSFLDKLENLIDQECGDTENPSQQKRVSNKDQHVQPIVLSDTLVNDIDQSDDVLYNSKGTQTTQDGEESEQKQPLWRRILNWFCERIKYVKRLFGFAGDAVSGNVVGLVARATAS